MCMACHNQCSRSDDFDRRGCDGCFEPDCWSEDDFHFGDDMPANDEDDGGLVMPLAGARRAGDSCAKR